MHVLLTRPEGSNKGLASALKQASIDYTVVPLMAIQPVDDPMLALKLQQAQDLIFVSVRAVDALIAAQPVVQWRDKVCFAIGEATQARLASYGVVSHCAPLPHTSENLFRLMQNFPLKHRQILIVRGQGGRTYLEEYLTQAQAQVSCADIYQRVRPKLDKDTLLQAWKSSRVSTVLITSGFVLKFFEQRTTYQDEDWVSQLQFIVPSLRLQQIAKAMGLMSVWVAAGADDVSMLNQIYALRSAEDGKGHIDE